MNLHKLLTVGFLTLLAGSLVSCNTFLGVGRDLQQAGEGIEKTVYRKNTNPSVAPAQQGQVQAY